VEYEDRRDADDAYHDMHNKRIGRDDVLKIEVGLGTSPPIRPDQCIDSALVGSYSPFRFVAV
jgi:hypothetical protein